VHLCVTGAPGATPGAAASASAPAKPVAKFPKEEDIVKLNVGGVKFQTTLTTLRSRPNTRLSEMFAKETLKDQKPCKDGFFFVDRNGDAFETILEFYRYVLLSVSLCLSLSMHFPFPARAVDYFALPMLLRWMCTVHSAGKDARGSFYVLHHSLEGFSCTPLSLSLSVSLCLSLDLFLVSSLELSSDPPCRALCGNTEPLCVR
jgi:BTB/POZ domain